MVNISIFGLGKLGASMVGAYASKGHKVIGVDINSNYVELLKKGLAPVDETDLQKYITDSMANIEATSDYDYAVKNSDISFIIVPTPSDQTGGFSVAYVKSVVEGIGKVLKGKSSYHLVVLTSTVLPGDSDEFVIPVLERYSEKKCGVDFGFSYNPEFIAIGSVVYDLLHHDFILICEKDQKSGDILEGFYRETLGQDMPIKRMSIPSAELSKISVNHYITTKITFANMLAEVSEKIPGANVTDVVGALGLDSRIGKKYLRPGLGYGGPCFPRDNRAFAAMASKRGVDAPYALQTDKYNNHVADRMVEFFLEHVPTSAVVGIYGLSYKPGTSFAEESQAVEIAKRLVKNNYVVRVYEPSGYAHARLLLGDEVIYSEGITDFVDNSEVLFLSNMIGEAQAFMDMVHGQNKTIIDPWRQISAADIEKCTSYLPMGICLL